MTNPVGRSSGKVKKTSTPQTKGISLAGNAFYTL
jgi:hypothetical protein